MSPNHVIPADNGPLSPIAERVMKCASLTYDVSADGIVIAVRSDLIVNSQALADSPKLREALEQVAEPRGNLAEIYGRGGDAALPDADRGAASPEGKQVDPDYEPRPDGPLSKVELWRLRDQAATRSTSHAGCAGSWTTTAMTIHDAIASDEPAPAGGVAEPRRDPLAPRRAAARRAAAAGAGAARGVRRATGQRAGGEGHDPRQRLHRGAGAQHAPDLDARVVVVAGQALDTSTDPPTWVTDRPDGVYTDAAGQLDGISGHGTFIAGLIAHIAPQTRLEVVGLRNQEVEIGALQPERAAGAVRDRGRDRARDAAAQQYRRDPVRLRVPDARRLPVASVRGGDGRAAPAERATRRSRRRGRTGRQRAVPRALLAGGAARRDRRGVDQPSRQRPRVVLQLGGVV